MPGLRTNAPGRVGFIRGAIPDIQSEMRWQSALAAFDEDIFGSFITRMLSVEVGDLAALAVALIRGSSSPDTRDGAPPWSESEGGEVSLCSFIFLGCPPRSYSVWPIMVPGPHLGHVRCQTLL